MLGGGGLYRGWNPHPKINEDQERNLPQHYVQLKDRTGPGGAPVAGGGEKRTCFGDREPMARMKTRSDKHGREI
jgi:hypothetical protein